MGVIEKLLGHTFADPKLLSAALTHSSLRKQTRTSYERLEFLGDRVLGLVIADMILRRFPKEAEGDLAKRQAALIKRDTLADVARTIGLGPYLKMSLGEEKLGGRDNPNMLSDTMEALIAALYLDGSLETARGFIAPLWSPLIEATKAPPKDAKTALQEMSQKLRLGLPTYHLLARTGPDHAPKFLVEIRLPGQESIHGTGKSKREAEQAGAAIMLELLS